MPEDSVTPETQTLVVLIRRKGCVGCFESSTFKIALSILTIFSLFYFILFFNLRRNKFIYIFVKYSKYWIN